LQVGRDEPLQLVGGNEGYGSGPVWAACMMRASWPDYGSSTFGASTGIVPSASSHTLPVSVRSNCQGASGSGDRSTVVANGIGTVIVYFVTPFTVVVVTVMSGW
jgi:hypothetical protein